MSQCAHDHMYAYLRIYKLYTKYVLIIITLTAALVSPTAPLDNKNLITSKRLYETALDNGVSPNYNNNNIISK